MAKLQKEIKFKDQVLQSHKAYSPIEIQCLKYCPSIQLKDLKNFIENYEELREEKLQQSRKSDSQWTKEYPQYDHVAEHNILQSINLRKSQQSPQNIKIRNYKRRSTLLANMDNPDLSKQNSKPNEEQTINQNLLHTHWNIPYLLFGHNPCPFNPISLVMNQIPQKMRKKIMNLLKFYKATFVRYPSLQTFLASGCNSTKIICGPTELQDIAKKVEAQEYPFTFSCLTGLSTLSSKTTLEMFNNDSTSMHANQHTNCRTLCNEPQDLTLYCFCNEGFENNFTTNNIKLIGILRDKLIQIRFFKNLIDLVKELFKDQHIKNSGDLLKEILKEKALLLSNKKLRSNIETGAWCQGDDNADNVVENTNENQSKSTSSNELTKKKFLQSKITRKDSFSLLTSNPKLLAKISQKSIKKINKISPYISGLISGSQICNLSPDQKPPSPIIFKDERNPLSDINPNIYFLMHEKENDRYSIQSLPKKISRGLKNMKVKKVMDLESLVEKIKHQYISIVIISDNAKILQELYTMVEISAVENKIILIKRQETDTHETLINKVNEAREVGMLKLQNFHSYSFINLKIIVMGSKPFLKHIFNAYPYLDVKQFIDITIYKQHRKIREVISRKNQIIVSNVTICEICNIEYRGLTKAKIIYYEHQGDNRHMIAVGGRGDCKCNQAKQNSISSLKLDKILDMHPCHIPVYPYMNKKIQNSSAQISALFTKIKQKKSLPIFQTFPNQMSEILFLCADSWIIQQITMIIVRLFSNRYSSIWLCQWMAKKIVYDCIKQCGDVVKFLVDSIVSIYKGQVTTKSTEIIEQAKTIYKFLKQCLDEVSDIYQLGQVLLEMFVENSLFRKAVNYAWRNLLSLNKHEYPFECCTLFLVLFLGFRKSSAMKKNDSINDGTLKSFKALNSKSSINQNTDDGQKNQQNKGMQASLNLNCSLQKDTSFMKESTNSNNKNSNQSQCPLLKQTKDQEIEMGEEKGKTITSPKIYLKLMNFQKVYEDESLRKFFISRNNAFSYIYTTEFLVFEMIDEKEIDAMISSCAQKDIKLSNLAKNNQSVPGHSPSNQHKSGERPNYFQSSETKYMKKENFGSTHSSNGKKSSQKMSFLQQTPVSQSLLFSKFLSMTRSNSKVIASSPPKFKEVGPLELKPQKNIEILPSTDDSLIICIQNIEQLNYNMFMPFYRPSSAKNKQKKTFIIPPFTKLEINNNYSNINTLSNPSLSLITHQLKLSLDHQQRFLQKILEFFLVQKSQYYEHMREDQNMQHEREFHLNGAKLFEMQNLQTSSDIEQGQMIEKKDKEIVVLKPYSKIHKMNSLNPWEEMKLVDQKFKLPYTDQFFILMNEFKYFSAHHLIITQLPKTNMTNAYHAILLTRKGLYHEAQRILLCSNPFRFTVQQYINELRNRMITNHCISGQIESSVRNQPPESQRPKVMKWKVTYASKEEKFYLKEKEKNQISYCYNDDSLDVIYKQVFTKLKKKIDLSASEENKTSENVPIVEDDMIGHPQIATGTFVNTKRPVRRVKKQYSIALYSKDRQICMLNIDNKDLVTQIDNSTSTISPRSYLKKLSMKSRDSILNDIKFFQQIQQNNPMLSEMSTQLRRRQRVTVSGSSSFMFGNSTHAKQGVTIERTLRRSSRLSFQNQALCKNSLFEMNVQEQIEEKSSSSSLSEQDILKNIRMKDKKITPIQVKTKNISNFFVENTQELKKKLSLLKVNTKTQPTKTNKLTIDNEIQHTSKSIETEEFTPKSQENISQNHERSIAQKIRKQDHQQPTKETNRISQVNQSTKGQILLFKHFESQNQLQNDSWMTQQDNQKLKNQNISNQNRKIVKTYQHQEGNNSIKNENDPQGQFKKHENIGSCNVKGIVLKKGAINSFQMKKCVQITANQNSQQNENKLKCRFALQISSESSSDEETLQHITKETSENNKAYLKFTFKKKLPDEIDYQTASPMNNYQNKLAQQKDGTTLNQITQGNSLMPQIKSSQNKIDQIDKINKVNRISQVSSQGKTSSEDENISQDHEEFLKSHTSLFIWHNKVQTQKHFKSSKKLLNSSKHTISNTDIQQKSNSDFQHNFQQKFTNTFTQENTQQFKQRQLKGLENILKQNEAKRKQKHRTDKNSFTFMQPCTNGSVKHTKIQHQHQETQIDPQSQHIINFHSQLMNNSLMFITDPVTTQQNNNYFSKKSLSPKGKLKLNVSDESQYETFEKSDTKYDIEDERNHQKFTIVVKTLKNKDCIDEFIDRSNLDKMIRKSALDYNHQKDNFQLREKLNLSSDKPIRHTNQHKVLKDLQDDSWQDSESNNDANEEDQLIEMIAMPSGKKNNLSLSRAQANHNKSQKSVMNKMVRDESKVLPQKKHEQDTRHEMKQYEQEQCKIHPEELIYLSPKENFQLKKEKIRRNAEFCEQEKKQSARRLNIASLRNLKLNCDIRRKR